LRRAAGSKGRTKNVLEARGNLLFQHAPPVPVETPLTSSDEASPLFSNRCLELASVAPTDEIREVLLKIADWCQAELEPEPEQNAALHPSQQRVASPLQHY